MHNNPEKPTIRVAGRAPLPDTPFASEVVAEFEAAQVGELRGRTSV
jgi:hypothetical protein